MHPSELRTSSLFCQSLLIQCKVFSLIQLLKTGRADTIKEALFLDGIEEANLRRQAERKYAEKKEENYREEQLRLLREQNSQLEKAKQEQEETNKKIIKQNEELLRKANDLYNKD